MVVHKRACRGSMLEQTNQSGLSGHRSRFEQIQIWHFYSRSGAMNPNNEVSRSHINSPQNKNQTLLLDFVQFFQIWKCFKVWNIVLTAATCNTYEHLNLYCRVCKNLLIYTESHSLNYVMKSDIY